MRYLILISIVFCSCGHPERASIYSCFEDSMTMNIEEDFCVKKIRLVNDWNEDILILLRDSIRTVSQVNGYKSAKTVRSIFDDFSIKNQKVTIPSKQTFPFYIRVPCAAYDSMKVVFNVVSKNDSIRSIITVDDKCK